MLKTLSDPQKRARFDSGEDLVDPSEMFNGSGTFGNGGMQIDPEIILNMMGQGGTFSTFSGGGPFSGRVPRAGPFSPGGFGF